jgi:hypothetical protein
MEAQMSSQTSAPDSTRALSKDQIPELGTIEIAIEGEIGTMTLNRPESLNAMSPEMIGELVDAFAWLADLAPLRALIVTGAGNAFSAGGDVNWFRTGVESEEIDLPSNVRRGAEVLHQAIVDLRRIPYPVIAAVNGPAAGAGFSLALACDIRIASEEAFFACAYGRIGASPDGGMTYFLPRVIGPAKALELMLNDPNRGRGRRRPRRPGPPEGREAGRKGAPLRADVEASDRPEPRQQPHRPPAAGAARDRRQHGHRGPAGGRGGVLRRPDARVQRRVNPPSALPVFGFKPL